MVVVWRSNVEEIITSNNNKIINNRILLYAGKTYNKKSIHTIFSTINKRHMRRTLPLNVFKPTIRLSLVLY